MATPATSPLAKPEQSLHLVSGREINEERIQSAAFHYAQLESERLRVFAVLAFVIIFILVTLVRVFLIRTVSGTTPWGWNLTLASTVIVYELWILHKTNLALKAVRNLPKLFWVLSTILETSTPAFGIAFLTSEHIEAVYRPLASPGLLVFFIFIIVSTLRLNPWICLLSGVVATVTYVSAALYLGWQPPVIGLPAPITQTSVSLNAIVLLMGGMVAAAVAVRWGRGRVAR